MSVVLNDAGRSQAELRRLAAEAWNAVKSADDPAFDGCAQHFQETLVAWTVDALNGNVQPGFALAVHNAALPKPVVEPEPEPEPIADSEPEPEPIKPKATRKTPSR